MLSTKLIIEIEIQVDTIGFYEFDPNHTMTEDSINALIYTPPEGV